MSLKNNTLIGKLHNENENLEINNSINFDYDESNWRDDNLPTVELSKEKYDKPDYDFDEPSWKL